MYFIGALAIFCLSALTAAESWNNLTHGKIVVCPIETQSVLDFEKNPFKYDECDWKLCTHLIILDDKFLQIPSVSDDKRNEEYKQIIDLRTKYPHLNISMTASPVEILKKYINNGGGSSAIADFSTKFADSLKSQGFDSIDFNFMDLQESFIKIERIANQMDVFPGLLGGLKHALNKRNLSMTSSFSTTFDFTSLKLNVSAYVDNFELFHIYQLGIDKDTTTTFGHAQNEMNRLNLSKKLENIMQWGIPREKIILGVMLGGPSAKAPIDQNVMEAKTGSIVGYNRVCEEISSNETYVKSIDRDTQLISLSYKDEKKMENFTIIYTSTQGIASYMKYAVEDNFTGVIAYSIAMDDFAGRCELDDEDDTWYGFYLGCGAYAPVPKRIDNKFPFMRTINKALYKTVKGATGGAPSCTHSSFYVAFVLLGILLSSVLSI